MVIIIIHREQIICSPRNLTSACFCSRVVLQHQWTLTPCEDVILWFLPQVAMQNAVLCIGLCSHNFNDFNGCKYPSASINNLQVNRYNNYNIIVFYILYIIRLQPVSEH